MPSPAHTVVIIGTGGTIAGTAAEPQDHTGYRAGTLNVQQLLQAVPALARDAESAIEAESLAQIDSCDMTHATWLRLAQAVQRHARRPEVAGIVITHGTDTLEETACFLRHTVDAAKPVVLTAAMRPATAASPDGPQNLIDALLVAREPAARGVVAVVGGTVFAADALRKVHGHRVDAFSAGDAGPLALVQNGRIRLLRPWPDRAPAFAPALQTDPAQWPVVDIVTSHAGARGASLQALVDAGTRGIVIAGTGNGSVHHSLLAAALQAVQQGVRVVRASRCVEGGVIDGDPAAWPGGIASAGDATPAQARVALMLALLLGRSG